MRKRMLDPEIFDSADSKDWNTYDFTVMVAAICSADDEGRGRVTQIKKNIISMVPEKKFQKSLKKLNDSIIIYQKIYFFLPKFKNYQTISHPKPSKFPEPNILEDKDLTLKSSINSVDSFQNHSILSKVSLKEVNLKEVKGNLDNANSSNFDLPLPLLTKSPEQNTSTEPEDYEDIFQVTDSIKNLLSIHCKIYEPDKSTLSALVNLVMKTDQVRNSTAFKNLRDTFIEFKNFPDEKQNLKYLYSRAKGRMNDMLIKRREELAKREKDQLNNNIDTISKTADVNIGQIANKFQMG